LWIWQMAGTKDLLRWLLSYFSFTIAALVNFVFGGWAPALVGSWRGTIEPRWPGLWLWLLSWTYTLRNENSSIKRWL
jgi:lycopene cyclase CruA